MEKVFKQIDKIIIIIKVLCMEGKIQKNTYDEIRLSLVDMEDELKRFTITDSTSDKSFSNMEKFVNEHINYADSGTLINELHRRGFRISDNKLFKKQNV